jgi:hypothetical protein
MTLNKGFTFRLNHNNLTINVLQAGFLAITLAALFLIFIGLNSGEWIVLPIITCTFGGAFGGLIYHFITQVWFQNSQYLPLFRIAGLLLYCVLIWLGLIIAFSITGLWD